MIESWRIWLDRYKKYKYIKYGKYDYRVTELAKTLGVSRMTIHRWIKGKGSPGNKYSKKIMQFIKSRESSK